MGVECSANREDPPSRYDIELDAKTLKLIRKEREHD
jgi:uncharacterized membrane protein YkoI